MKRLIDADDLMNELLKWNTEAVRTDNHINTIFSSGMIGIVRLSPTVDAVPVIRCKDCRWGKETCGNIECNSEYHGYDWFCANGERKEENGK